MGKSKFDQLNEEQPLSAGPRSRWKEKNDISRDNE